MVDAGTNGMTPTVMDNAGGGANEGVGVPICGVIGSPLCCTALNTDVTNLEGYDGFRVPRLEPADGGKGGRCSIAASTTEGRRPG